MPTEVWFALKRSLQLRHCKSDTTSQVHDPKSQSKIRTGRCGSCSRSISSLRDVVNGCSSRRRSTSDLLPDCSSPRSMASSELMNPITHEVVFNNSKCEIKILGVGGTRGKAVGVGGGHRSGNLSPGPGFLGTLRPGTPGPKGQYVDSCRSRRSGSGGGGSAQPPSPPPRGGSTGGRRRLKPKLGNAANSPPLGSSSSSSAALMCQKCAEQFTKLEAVEAHHLSNHAVTELSEGDSSRKIVEIICQASWLKSETGRGQIERVLKVHNMQKTLARLEEYREMVKIRASKLSKKHPRCLADGNELLRFYGTAAACSLGADSSGLCVSNICGVCRILRRGFPKKKEMIGSKGIFTSSTSGRALESTHLGEDEQENRCLRKALVVCRVIAGRVHKPLEDFRDMAVIPLGYNSVAGKVGCFSNIEELYILNPKALLPCFVVIFRP